MKKGDIILTLFIFLIIRTGYKHCKLFFYSFQFVQHYKTMCRHLLPENDTKHLPVNKYKHVSHFIKPNSCPIQTPNFDTLYSNAILDLTQGYVKLIIPKYIYNVYNVEKKYYSVQLIDLAGNNCGFISLRNNINEYSNYIIINRNMYNSYCESERYLENAPNRLLVDSWFLYAILRIQVDFTDETDYTNSVLYQEAFRIEYKYIQPNKVYISEYLKHNLNQNIHVSNIDILTFYVIFKHCYQFYSNFKYNYDYWDFNENSFYLHMTTRFCRKIIDWLLHRDYKGWISRRSFDNIKKYVDENIFKTMISWKYLYAIDECEAVYYMNRYDSSGELLSGNHVYVISFTDICTYSNCFWSLSSYENETAQFEKNWNDVYSKGNNVSTRITILLTHRKLEQSYLNYVTYKCENLTSIEDYCLYTPREQYYLVLRIYYPRDNISQFKLPEIVKLY